MVGLQLQSYGYVERIEHPDTQPCHTVSPKLSAHLKCAVRKAYFNPNTGFAIALELPVYRLRFPWSDPALKYVLADCVCPLSAMQRR
jgi:hypothetical protein